MISLGVETSTHSGSLALFSDNTIIDSLTWEKSSSHSELITLSFLQLLNKNKISLAEISRIGVGVGPGSFTGIRVAVNFARSLAYSIDQKIFVISSLELLCYQSELIKLSRTPVIVLQYAFRDILYCNEYLIDEGRVQNSTKIEALTADQFLSRISRPILVLGSGYEYLQRHYTAQNLVLCLRSPRLCDGPSAVFFQNSGLTAVSNTQLSAWNQTIPLYIRGSEAEEKLKKNH